MCTDLQEDTIAFRIPNNRFGTKNSRQSNNTVILGFETCLGKLEADCVSRPTTGYDASFCNMSDGELELNANIL